MITKVVHKGLGLPRAVPGYLAAARSLKAGRVPLVMYHGVVDTPPSMFHWCHLETSAFEAQLVYLDRHYRVLPLSDLVEAWEQERPLPSRAAAITFDDGYRSVLTTALPVLERLQLPFTVFVVTGHVEDQELIWQDRLFHALEITRVQELEAGGKRFPLSTPGDKVAAHRALGPMLKGMSREEKNAELARLVRDLKADAGIDRDHCLALMDWDEVVRLSQSPLATIGSHSHTHQILSRCTVEEQRQELLRSRDMLKDRLGGADLFAYPNGTRDDFTAVTQGLLRELGFRCGLATTPGLNGPGADLYALQRVNVGADTTMNDFQLRMLGW